MLRQMVLYQYPSCAVHEIILSCTDTALGRPPLDACQSRRPTGPSRRDSRKAPLASPNNALILELTKLTAASAVHGTPGSAELFSSCCMRVRLYKEVLLRSSGCLIETDAVRPSVGMSIGMSVLFLFPSCPRDPPRGGNKKKAFYLQTYHGTQVEHPCTACAVKPPDDICDSCDFSLYDSAFANGTIDTTSSSSSAEGIDEGRQQGEYFTSGSSSSGSTSWDLSEECQACVVRLGFLQ